MNILEKGAPLPVSLGACADLYHDVRALRLEMQKQVDAIQARETEVKEHIIASATVTDAGAVGRRYIARVISKAKPQIADWGVFCSWVRKNDRFDCLQKRISEDAVKQTMDAESRVLPGLQIVNVKDVSLTKV